MLRRPWRKLERGRKQRSWDLKTASSRHCRSSGSHRTLSGSLGRPSWSPFYPFPLWGLWNRACGWGMMNVKCQKKEKEPLTCLSHWPPAPILAF